MDRRFLNAYIDPAPFRLLGRSLYPWCLKYRVRLTAFDSPLITGAREITPADLIFACQVCAEEPLGDRLRLADEFRIMRLSRNRHRFEEALDSFAGYILVANWPKFWDQNNKKSGGSSGMPWPLAIVSNLIANGIPEQRAWEMPECQAIWLNSAFAIGKGADVAIMSPEEEAFIEEETAREAASNPAKESDPNVTVPRS